MTKIIKNAREVIPPTGNKLTAKSWLTEAPMRMLMNNLHPDVAENPDELVVYGGVGKAARSWKDFDKIIVQHEHYKTLLITWPTILRFEQQKHCPAGLMRHGMGGENPEKSFLCSIGPATFAAVAYNSSPPTRHLGPAN